MNLVEPLQPDSKARRRSCAHLTGYIFHLGVVILPLSSQTWTCRYQFCNQNITVETFADVHLGGFEMQVTQRDKLRLNDEALMYIHRLIFLSFLLCGTLNSSSLPWGTSFINSNRLIICCGLMIIFHSFVRYVITHPETKLRPCGLRHGWLVTSQNWT